MRQDISNFVTNCIPCLESKTHRAITPELGPRPVLMPRFHEVTLDIMGPLPLSEGHKYLLTIVDRTSRWFEAIPLVEATSAQCAEAFIRHWVKNFGLPLKALSDNGNTFCTKVWQGINKAHSNYYNALVRTKNHLFP